MAFPRAAKENRRNARSSGSWTGDGDRGARDVELSAENGHLLCLMSEKKHRPHYSSTPRPQS